MVFLAISEDGLAEALRSAGPVDGAVWCGSNAISEDDYRARADGNLSRFVYSIDGSDAAAIADALQTIKEHHPGQRIWVETLHEI
ncbi:hypothetical protein [Acidovorax sp.]|uniref:hypothetical protein n=1 Tax=Acidovorax sp. TaxID=1872122 RepID=UPI00391F3AE1